MKDQEAAYFVSDNTLWVALYMPTTATWDKKGVVIQQECKWPAEKTKIEIVKGGKRFAMKLRKPYWATDLFEVKLNGKPINHITKTAGYVDIAERKWKQGDIVEITMPFTKHIHYGPDKFENAWLGTLMYGPLAMTTSGIKQWNEAVAVIDSHLDSITANPPTTVSGTHGNLYTLTLNGRTFVPDYAANKNATHYLKINSGTANLSTRQLANSSSSIALAEERIKERIQGRNPRKRQMQTGRKGISLIGDIQERIKLIDSKGYEHKAKLTILKEAARTLNYLTENNLLQYSDLEKKVEDIHYSYARTGEELKSVEARLREIQPLIKNISKYPRARIHI